MAASGGCRSRTWHEDHRANLVSGERFTLIGMGIVEADGFLYITQEFTRPCDPPRSKRRKDLPE